MVGEGVWPCVLVVEGVSGGDAVACGEEVGVGGEVGAVPVLLVDGVVVVGDWGVPVLALRRSCSVWIYLNVFVGEVLVDDVFVVFPCAVVVEIDDFWDGLLQVFREHGSSSCSSVDGEIG